MGDFQGTPFQVRTSTEITDSSFIVFKFLDQTEGGIGTVKVKPTRLEVTTDCCGDPTGLTHEGTSTSGIWTFLKTLTHITVWFNDALVTTYLFAGCDEDQDGVLEECSMEGVEAYGIEFSDSDAVSEAYRTCTNITTPSKTLP